MQNFVLLFWGIFLYFFYTFQTIFAESQKKNSICKCVYANELYLSNENLHRQTFMFKNPGVAAVVI